MDTRIRGEMARTKGPTRPKARKTGPVGPVSPDDLRDRDRATNAFLEVFETPEGGPPPGKRGSLDGLTFAVKEVIDQAGHRIPWGLPPLEGRIARETASAVSRIKAHGALCVGTTRSTALAITGDSGSRNPWDPTRSPGGSSAGSAAAVGAGLVDFALGTQTVGSIIRPAAYCGVVGFKPTMGHLPLDHVALLSKELDHLGLLARDVATARAVYTLFQDGGPPLPTRRVRLVAPWFRGPVAPEALAALGQAAALVDSLGYATEVLPLPADIVAEEEAVLGGLLARGIRDNHRCLIQENAARFPNRLVALVQSGDAIDDAAYGSLLARRDGMRSTMDSWIEPGVLLLTLSVSDLPPLLGEGTGSRDPQRLWSLLGWPTLALPLGAKGSESHGRRPMPSSVQLIGPPGRDFDLLAFAARLEDALLTE
ncbi:MAG: amidase [Rhodospirillum sp.]|nr:amidase [Rhodospirillum sp.]